MDCQICYQADKGEKESLAAITESVHLLLHKKFFFKWIVKFVIRQIQYSRRGSFCKLVNPRGFFYV